MEKRHYNEQNSQSKAMYRRVRGGSVGVDLRREPLDRHAMRRLS